MESPWARIGVNFYRHPKTRPLSGDAKHLFIASILHCVEFGTDGHFSAKDAPFIAGTAGVNPSIGDELLDAGAWIQTGDDMQVYGFLDWQTPAEKIKQRSEAGRKAAEARWSKKDPPDDANGNAIRIANGNAEKSREEKTSSCSPAKAGRARDSDFDHFWQTYPRKVGKKKAITAWRSALKDADAKAIIDGAERYEANCTARDLPKQFIAHPTTWLNRGGWDDELVDPDTPQTRTEQIR